MTKKILFCLLAILGLSACCAVKEKHPTVATTVDFLDYCFFDRGNTKDLFPLEVYEERLKTMADCGVKKIYLRVNCLGLTLYPTHVTTMYGDNGQYHWNNAVEAARLTKTIRTYDVCKETIRICHKYGMEAWCWESLCDGGGRGYSDLPFGESYSKLYERLEGNPFRDPYFMEHPEYYAWRDPKLNISKEELERLNGEASQGTIARILVKDTNATGKLPRIKPEEVEIYVSDDNINYTRYTAPFQCRGFVDGARNTCVEISGLAIDQRYVKLAHPTYQDSRWALALRNPRNDCKVFDANGREIVTYWGTLCHEGQSKEKGGFVFDKFDPAGWDYKYYQIGFTRGMPDIDARQRYFEGVLEFQCPQAMEHHLARFAELANYPFDGYMINYRTHSRKQHPEEYGYNPEVREIYLKQHGVDIWKEKADLAKLGMIRADGIAKFLAGCKKLISGRPLFITGIEPVPAGQKPTFCGPLGKDPKQIASRGMSLDMFSHLPWLYKRYLAEDKSVDGIIMTGGYFPEYFTKEITGGRKITIGLYRERPSDGGAYTKDYNFAEDFARIYADPNIDEIELYETINYTNAPDRLDALRKITGGRK